MIILWRYKVQIPFENFFYKLSSKKQCLAVFLIALFIAAVIFIPFIIADGGYFFFYGDFNVQQIPFYMHAHDMVRSGNIGWDWGTDLGASFVGSYSFYLLFSPFFWFTLLFPTLWVPYMMAPLLMLKGAFSALTAFLYIRRFTRSPIYALVGSIMYAFSGFAMHNVFFNHFYEPIVFFPLLLLGMEKSWRDGKFGCFALAIAVNAAVNYWFFIGEVIFCIIYFFVREYYSRRRFNIGRFCLLFVEAVLGLGLAMVVFLPSVLSIMGNTRVGLDSVIFGQDLWYYSNPQRYLGILHAIFMMPDLPSINVLSIMGNTRVGLDSVIFGQDLWYYSNPQRYLGILHAIFMMPDLPSINNFFPNHGAVWSSLAAYIPVLGAVGVVSYCVYRKSSWLRSMLLISFTMAMVPVLNHLFVLMNNSYYTRWFYMPVLLMSLRWFYMPVLLMSLATAVSLQDSEKSPLKYSSSNIISLNAGFKLCAIAIILLTVISGATPIRSDGDIKLGMYSIAAMFIATSALTVATPIRSDGDIKLGMYSIAAMFIATSALTVLGYIVSLVWYKTSNATNYSFRLVLLTCVGCMIFGFSTILIGKLRFNGMGYIVSLVWYKTSNATNYSFRLVLLTCVGCMIFGFSTILIGKLRFNGNGWISAEAIPARDDMRIDSADEFYRIDAADSETNMPIFWNMPAVQAFHSVVPVSIMKFYPEIGEKRDVSSKPSFSNKSLKSLLSVKYIYQPSDKERLDDPSYRYLTTRHNHDIYEFEDYIPMGFAYSSYMDEKKWSSIPQAVRTDYMLYAVQTTRHNHDIYEFEDYIPMGFAYSSYMDEKKWSSIPQAVRTDYMLYAVQLNAEAIRSNSDILTPFSEDVSAHGNDHIGAIGERQADSVEEFTVTKSGFVAKTNSNSDILTPFSEDVSAHGNDHIGAIGERQADSVEEFTVTKSGFVAKTNYSTDRLVFFSVPYDKGWSASVNGTELKIEVANIGFMAVRVPRGEQTVVFEYSTYGMNFGGVVSVISLIGIAAGVWLTRKKSIPATESECDRYGEI